MKAGLLVFAAVLVFSASLCAAQPSEWCVDLDQITATVLDSTITVHHAAAFSNCCPTDIVYELDQQGAWFFVREIEVEPQCLCLCCFNFSVDIEHVAPDDDWIDFTHFRAGSAPGRQVIVLR